MEKIRQFMEDDFIPIEYWGRDHWSLLAYIGSVMIEVAGFQVGFDERMRQNRRNYRVMMEECKKPKRISRIAPSGIVGCMWKPEYTSRLNNGISENHDDWSCVQDMVHFGILKGKCQPNEILHFTRKGRSLYNKLIKHKQTGGQFSNFSIG